MTDEELEAMSSEIDETVRNMYSDFIMQCVAFADSKGGYYRDVFYEYMKDRLDEPDFMYRVSKHY